MIFKWMQGQRLEPSTLKLLRACNLQPVFLFFGNKAYSNNGLTVFSMPEAWPPYITSGFVFIKAIHATVFASVFVVTRWNLNNHCPWKSSTKNVHEKVKVCQSTNCIDVPRPASANQVDFCTLGLMVRHMTVKFGAAACTVEQGRNSVRKTAAFTVGSRG